MRRLLVIKCDRARNGWRHRWFRVEGTMSTPEHPYTERRCAYCLRYESEVFA